VASTSTNRTATRDCFEKVDALVRLAEEQGKLLQAFYVVRGTFAVPAFVTNGS
jgi:hypothetical protein